MYAACIPSDLTTLGFISFLFEWIFMVVTWDRRCDMHACECCTCCSFYDIFSVVIFVGSCRYFAAYMRWLLNVLPRREVGQIWF